MAELRETNSLWAILAVMVCNDLHFEFPAEIVDYLGTIGISTYYNLGHANSNFEYYL